MISDSSPTRWWETYALRYFVGMTLGGLSVHHLSQKLDLPWLPDLAEHEALKNNNFGTWLILYGALGLAYCYIASAPMLVLHSTRMSMRKVCLSCSTLTFSIVGVAICLTLVFAHNVDPSTAISGTIFVLLLLLQIALIFTSIERRIKDSPRTRFLTFYKRLATERRLAETNIIPSYMHMREHGNAFANFILVAALTLILSEVPREYSIYALIAWVAPGAACWILASQLEAAVFSGQIRASVAAAEDKKEISRWRSKNRTPSK